MDSAYTSKVPSFLPGLLVVSVFIGFSSILVGWRNYMKHRIPQIAPLRGEWTLLCAEEDQHNPEKPRLWEVDVGRRGGGEELLKGWEQIMPLSVTSLTPELPPRTPDAPPGYILPHTPPRLPRFDGLSHNAAASHPPPPLISPHRLQVSVLISMPSQGVSMRSIYRSQSPVVITPLLVSDQDIGGKTPSRASTSSLCKDSTMDIYGEDGEEGIPQVAFGVVVLSWKGREHERTDILT